MNQYKIRNEIKYMRILKKLFGGSSATTITMKSRKRIGIASAIALATVLSGCATENIHHGHQAQFLPYTGDSSTPTLCRAVLVQNDPFIASKITQANQVMVYDTSNPISFVTSIGASYAMNGIAKGINSAANHARADRATKEGAPLQGHGIGETFRRDFDSSLSASVHSSSWLHATSIETNPEDVTKLTAEINQHPVVQINMIYHLSYDASALIMQAHLFFFRQGQTNATYVRYYTYYSEPVGPKRDDAAVAQWTASNQALLRQRMDEGRKEIMAMLNLDFFHPVLRNPTEPTVTIACYDPLQQSQVKWKGVILRNDSSRILCQEQSGNFFSVVPSR